MARNLVSLALSGQMCTAPQNIYVPRAARRIERRKAASASTRSRAPLAAALEKTTADAARAVELTGAIQASVVERIEKARALGLPVLADASRWSTRNSRTPACAPLLLSAQAGNPAIGQEWFGPHRLRGGHRFHRAPPIPPSTASSWRATA